MKLVSTLVVARDDADILDAHLRFQLNAGVDLVLVAGADGEDEIAAILGPFVQSGHVELVSGTAASLASLATTERGADWVLPTEADEFWWPRGESLKDVLAAIPPRYEIVQGLVRVFTPPHKDAAPVFERMTLRSSLLHSAKRGAEPLEWALRPLYRAVAGVSVEPDANDDRRIPLRAWYPIEVLRFPLREAEQARRRPSSAPPRSQLEADAAEAHRAGRLLEWYADESSGERRAEGLENGSLIVDERLRDAIRLLGAEEEPGGAVPLVLTPPGVVDDASYAIECAAVGEVDLAKLERQIRELEGRIAWLEERFWPRVLRNVRRIVRR